MIRVLFFHLGVLLTTKRLRHYNYNVNTIYLNQIRCKNVFFLGKIVYTQFKNGRPTRKFKIPINYFYNPEQNS